MRKLRVSMRKRLESERKDNAKEGGRAGARVRTLSSTSGLLSRAFQRTSAIARIARSDVFAFRRSRTDGLRADVATLPTWPLAALPRRPRLGRVAAPARTTCATVMDTQVWFLVFSFRSVHSQQYRNRRVACVLAGRQTANRVESIRSADHVLASGLAARGLSLFAARHDFAGPQSR